MHTRLVRPVIVAALAVLAASAACARSPQPDAYGNVEAVEVIVGAETGGQLLVFNVDEGQRIEAQAIVASVDPSDLAFERDSLTASREANDSRVDEIGQQVDVLRAERAAATAERDAAAAQREALVAQEEIARRAYERTERLFAQQAATAQQLDQAEKEARVLRQQVTAQESQMAAHDQQIAAQTQRMQAVQAQRETAVKQVAASQAQVARVGDRIRRSEVRNPIAGTVLVTYVKAGEIVQAGQPLYKIANLEAVEVRAYITAPQLSAVRLGQEAQVTMDAGEGRRVRRGTVSWVSSEAEFTPTPIQTRDERADLVYAVKIRTPNTDGSLKIGMPVDVRFNSAGGRP